MFKHISKQKEALLKRYYLYIKNFFIKPINNLKD
jgi:hypothetical protein